MARKDGLISMANAPSVIYITFKILDGNFYIYNLLLQRLPLRIHPQESKYLPVKFLDISAAI